MDHASIEIVPHNERRMCSITGNHSQITIAVHRRLVHHEANGAAEAPGNVPEQNMSNSTRPAQPEPLWTANDVATHLKMSESWVRKRTADGTLPCIRLGASVRYSPGAIHAYATGEAVQPDNLLSFKRRR